MHSCFILKSIYRNSRIWLVTMSVASLLGRCQGGVTKHEWDPSDGYVPDSISAIKIAEVVFVGVYGENVLEKKPFVATLKNNIWIVDGTIDEGKDGGVPHIEIQKSDGKILYLIHGK